ncbi:gamma-secretase subunit pen-2-like isoform X2 [Contarinia nasturtii]|uniref:gamma-secretase subunit pen-2-like isoform X2 n=1 Tax=Contarinia nasturtii TaxID=265458 RepID=UPI0012D4BDFC|nr:gamma-secretase subunit pen-2-like isoform X2 [Contarinia nasturtii]
MDISRATNDRKLYLCKWYFRVGFALLPFIWAVNTVWFFDEAFRKPAYDEQKSIRKYVIFSAIGALLWAIGLAAWITIYQTNRVAWGEFADSISFIIPLVLGH